MISVIVPVYNSEKYLRRCIDSVLAQTYSDLKLILIDDGSTDNSGRICEEYAATDDRIVVLHQENKGQAVARNAGLDYVFEKDNSEWVSFIDSDDYVSPLFFSTLIVGAKESNSRISICNSTSKAENICCTVKEPTARLISTDDYYSTYNYTSVPWGKIIHKELLKNKRFPDKRKYEDEFLVYKVLFQCEYIAYTDAPMYYYLINETGVMKTEQSLDSFGFYEAYKDQIKFFFENQKLKSFNTISQMNLRMLLRDMRKDTVNKSDKIILRDYLRYHLNHYAKFQNISFRNNPEYYICAYPILGLLYKGTSLIYKVKKKIIKDRDRQYVQKNKEE